jgi:hypothetical protein
LGFHENPGVAGGREWWRDTGGKGDISNEHKTGVFLLWNDKARYGLLNFLGFRCILNVQRVCPPVYSVCAPAGGEMSGLKAHFLFAAKVARMP